MTNDKKIAMIQRVYLDLEADAPHETIEWTAAPMLTLWAACDALGVDKPTPHRNHAQYCEARSLITFLCDSECIEIDDASPLRTSLENACNRSDLIGAIKALREIIALPRLPSPFAT
jgi:hypothetical protein